MLSESSVHSSGAPPGTYALATSTFQGPDCIDLTGSSVLSSAASRIVSSSHRVRGRPGMISGSSAVGACQVDNHRTSAPFPCVRVVLTGLEPATSAVRGR